MPFQKGQSGNPGGRPKKEWTWGQLLEDVANEIEPKTGKPFRELVSKRLWVEAVNGSLLAAKEIMNRMEGMPKQTTDITSDGRAISVSIHDYGAQDNTSTEAEGSDQSE